MDRLGSYFCLCPSLSADWHLLALKTVLQLIFNGGRSSPSHGRPFISPPHLRGPLTLLFVLLHLMDLPTRGSDLENGRWNRPQRSFGTLHSVHCIFAIYYEWTSADHGLGLRRVYRLTKLISKMLYDVGDQGPGGKMTPSWAVSFSGDQRDLEDPKCVGRMMGVILPRAASPLRFIWSLSNKHTTHPASGSAVCVIAIAEMEIRRGTVYFNLIAAIVCLLAAGNNKRIHELLKLLVCASSIRGKYLVTLLTSPKRNLIF